MKKGSRDAWLVGISMAFLLACIIASAVLQSDRSRQTTPYASTSSAPDGTLALVQWLQALGYRVSREQVAAFAIPDDTAVTLILEPSQPILASEWEALDEFVENGGALVLAGRGSEASQAFGHYNFRLRPAFSAQGEALVLQNPLMEAPPIATGIDARPSAYFLTTRHDFAVHLAIAEGPVVVSFPEGRGHVILSATPFPFSNLGLTREGNPQLALNVVNAALAVAPPRGTGRLGAQNAIWFDEWHHGVHGVEREIIGPQQWLLRTPVGRSLLYAAGVIFVALLLQGRAFGRPLPLPREITRRAPLEYITAMANLSRRAGDRAAVLRRYHHELKRELGHRYRLAPSLPDEAFVEQLAAYRPDVDAAALRRLLGRLRRTQVSENDLVQIAAEAVRWMAKHQRAAG